MTIAASSRSADESDAAPAPVPRAAFDWRPLALVPALALVALPLVGSGTTWLTLTVAGLAMGMIVFITASGFSERPSMPCSTRNRANSG